jgi:flagellar biosynthesis/type III secretory pathway M-ring protein FliF/YscJ
MTALQKAVLGIVGIIIITVVLHYSMFRTSTSASVPYFGGAGRIRTDE